MTTIPDSNSTSNCNIFESIRGMSIISSRGSTWHGVAKTEIENLGGNKIFESAQRGNNFEVEKVGRENSVIWNKKDSNSIHVDPDCTKSNQPIRANSTNIGSIHD